MKTLRNVQGCTRLEIKATYSDRRPFAVWTNWTVGFPTGRHRWSALLRFPTGMGQTSQPPSSAEHVTVHVQALALYIHTTSIPLHILTLLKVVKPAQEILVNIPPQNIVPRDDF